MYWEVDDGLYLAVYLILVIEMMLPVQGAKLDFENSLSVVKLNLINKKLFFFCNRVWFN
jgi:hypothetical protein